MKRKDDVKSLRESPLSSVVMLKLKKGIPHRLKMLETSQKLFFVSKFHDMSSQREWFHFLM